MTLLRGAAGNATAAVSASASAGAARPPRIYFLFLAVDKVSNLGLWKAFFSTAPPGQYRALVHCKLPACAQMVAGSPLQVIPTVPSYYCTDLVSPMNHLIASALQDHDGLPHPDDKFVFVSDSTLPAKPFSYIYSTLSMRKGSDFCVFPSQEWATVASGAGMEIAVKHHQWVTLQRDHAERSWNLWKVGTNHHIMSHFGMNNVPAGANQTYGDHLNVGCLDEFWYMYTLYGALHQRSPYQAQDVHLSMFTNGPLRMAAAAGWQGECDTFVLWSQYLPAWGNNPFQRLHSSLDDPSVPHSGNSFRPGWWDKISTHGLRNFRQSSFLFIRKFIDNPRLTDGPDFASAYMAIVVNQ